MSNFEKGEARKSNDKIYDNDSDNIQAALDAGEQETTVGIKQIFKLHWPAAMWSMLLSLALVMEGMDVGLVNNFFGQQAYIDRFGTANAAGVKSIPANWQAAINNGQQIGAVLGLLFNGWAQSRFGSRRVYMLGMVLMAACIFCLVFAVNIPMLFVGNMLCGFPWGIFQTLTTTYASEISPVAMRGYLTAWVSMCWGSGSFLAAGVLRGSLGLPGNWAWRVPYMLQWAWPVPLFFVAFFAPESPWYLVRTEQYAAAEKALVRLASKNYYNETSLKQQIMLMKHTNERQKVEAANASYFDCFRGTNLRRTEIACIAFLIQVMSGQGICSYATVFLRAAGMDQVMAFNYSMAIQSTNIVSTGIAIILMGRVGRRTFYLFGTSAIGVCQLIIGIVGFVPNIATAPRSIVVAVMMIFINLSFKLSLGPACYTIVGEVGNSRIRAQTIVLARASYIVGGVISNQIIPRQLSTTAWNWGAKSGLFWFGVDAIAILYTFFRIPETRNRSFIELDYLFQHKVATRKFSKTHISREELAHTEASVALEVDEKAGEERIEEAVVKYQK